MQTIAFAAALLGGLLALLVMGPKTQAVRIRKR